MKRLKAWANLQSGLRKARPSEAALRFSPTAWAKLLYLRDRGSTEVGGFALTPADDLLFVGDIQLVRQKCSPVSVIFDDEAVADFFDAQVDRGLRPAQFARIWIHTHPGNCADPSLTDKETFARVFGKSEWTVMFILACGGQTYARLRFNVGPGGDTAIPASVDYSRPFDGSDVPAWELEYQANVARIPQALPELGELPAGEIEEFPVDLDSLAERSDWGFDDDPEPDFERFFQL